MAGDTTFIAVMGVFLKQQQTTAQAFIKCSDKLAQTASSHLKNVCGSLVGNNDAWSSVLGPIMLAAIDLYLSTLVSISAADENQGRVRARYHRNNAILSFHRAELLLLRARAHRGNGLQGMNLSLADELLSTTAQFTEELLTATIGPTSHYNDLSGPPRPPEPAATTAISDWSCRASCWSEKADLIEQYRDLLGPVGLFFGEERRRLVKGCHEGLKTARRAAQAVRRAIVCQQTVDGAMEEQEETIRQVACDLVLAHADSLLVTDCKNKDDQLAITDASLRCSDAFMRTADELCAFGQRRQQLRAAIPAVPKHQSTVQILLDASAARCDEIADWLLDPFLEFAYPHTERVSEPEVTLESLLKSFPDAAVIYLAQHYSDQCAAAKDQMEESEYHSRLAQYWGAANDAMKEYLAGVVAHLSNGARLADMDERAKYPSKAQLYRAQNYEASAVRVCQEAIEHQTQADRIKRNLQFSNADEGSILVEAAAAWESAARLALTAAESSAASVRAADLTYSMGNNGCFISAQLDGDAARWAELAQALERSVCAPAAVRWLDQQTIALNRHLRQQHEISHRGGMVAHYKWRTCHLQCTEALARLLDPLERARCERATEGSVGSTGESEIAGLDDHTRWLLPVALEFSELLKTYREQASSEGTVGHSPHEVAVELCGCLNELSAGRACSDSHAERTTLRRRRVQVLLLALDAHIHAQYVRRDILHQAADFLSTSLFPRSTVTGAAFERMSDSLLDNELPAEELLSHIGKPLPRSPLPPAVSDTACAIVQAVFARAATAEKLRFTRDAIRPAAQKCYEDAVTSYDCLIERLIRELELRVEGSHAAFTVANHARLAEESAEAYLHAAQALEADQDEAGKHWRRVAYCSVQQTRVFLMGDWLGEPLGAVASRSRAAAEHLTKGKGSQAVAHAHTRASDYAVLGLQRGNQEDDAALHYYQMGDCWEGIARASEIGNEQLRRLWEEKKELLMTLRAYDLVCEEVHGSRCMSWNLPSSAMNIPEDESVVSSVVDEEVDEEVDEDFDFRAAEQRLDQVEAQINRLEGREVG